MPIISSDAGILKAGDFQQKVRDLELLLIDQKAQTERKFTAMRESLFSKLERDIKTIGSKQAQADALNSQNLAVLRRTGVQKWLKNGHFWPF